MIISKSWTRDGLITKISQIVNSFWHDLPKSAKTFVMLLKKTVVRGWYQGFRPTARKCIDVAVGTVQCTAILTINWIVGASGIEYWIHRVVTMFCTKDRKISSSKKPLKKHPYIKVKLSKWRSF